MHSKKNINIDHCLEVMLDTSSIIAVAIDKKKKIIFFNKGAEKISGYEKDEILGKNCLKFIPVDIKTIVKSFISVAFKGETKQQVVPIITKSGEKKFVSWNGHRVKTEDGKFIIAAFGHDITDEIETKKHLQTSEEKFRTLFENISLGVYRVKANERGKFIDVNEALVKILGYDNKEHFLQNVYAEDLYPNPDQRREYNNAIIKRGFTKNEIINLKKKDGTLIVVSDTSTIVYDEKGKPAYFDGILEDITEKKQLEQKIREYAEHLESMVLHRTKELSDQTRRAIDASKAKTEFLANISHELRTPLTSIIGYIELLEDVETDKSPEKQKEYVDIIKKNAKHLLTLISDTLDISKIEQKQMPIRKEEISIQNLIQDIENVFRPLFQKKGVRLNIDIAENTPKTIYTDGQKLKQILFNLVSNALKFTPSGDVNIQAHLKKSQVVFEVKDTGIGIAEENYDKIFEAYQRTNHPLIRREEGSGLGLVITKKLTKLLGGKIQAKSTVGKGSCFTASIPTK